MEQYIIKGGNPLVGEVVIGGAKNAALGILAAAVMTDGECHIDNVPDVNDTNILLKAMEGIGAKVSRKAQNEVIISGKGIDGNGDLTVDNRYIRRMRASYYLVGALLGKYKKARVALPGGCNIGTRPIDQHIKGFEQLGAEVRIEGGMIVAEAKHLRGAKITFDVVSVGATINVMMAAALADGDTVLENAAREPHVVDVANFLNRMGADIRNAGTETIRIRGVKRFFKDIDYSIIPDQIEAGTFMVAAAATKGDVLVKNVIPAHLHVISSKLSDMGAEIITSDDEIRVIAKKRLKAVNVKTQPYPGFPTDMQPQLAVAMALAEGTSRITEDIFENRFVYADELNKMGAKIRVEQSVALINGVEKFSGAIVTTPDLRAGAALVIAGLAAEGDTIVEDIIYIQRGYERFAEKIRCLGGMIEQVDSDDPNKTYRNY
ncbi:MAG: UDP-N-acetylglucosamine 1-carboxyvinyltransferase [Lachnospiraceae bacterium]